MPLTVMPAKNHKYWRYYQSRSNPVPLNVGTKLDRLKARLYDNRNSVTKREMKELDGACTKT